ncbi:MAG: hypothetical protein ABL876_19010, partial [Chitinophagaceae bacterium]
LCSCGQKKDGATRTGEMPPDTAQLSPLDAGPVAEVKDVPAVTDTVPRSKRVLTVTDVEAQKLDSSTKIGHAGDLLLTFIGGGFIFTENNPGLIAGEMTYSQTYSNEAATELYVIIPAKEVNRMLADAKRGGLRIKNPGIGVEPVPLKQTADEITRKLADGKATGLVFTKFGVKRENR